MKPKVDIIFGGQFGSEGKGVIAGHLADDYDVHIRVGAPNAGHSFIAYDRLWKMQTIPCGWANPEAVLIIGRGGLIDPVLLRREVEAIAEVDPSIYTRLVIDPLCGILDLVFHEMEGGIHGEMHDRIGSTGEGVGPAREARISRDPERFRLYRDLAEEDVWFAQFEREDTPAYIEALRTAHGYKVLLEGAQGQGLSLIHGPWPHCTSTDPGPAQLCADVGIPLKDIGRIIAVFRTFPIRVAGTSGPLKDEMTWEEMSKRLGRETTEITTVTLKTRRIGKWDDELARQCVLLHGPTEIALTFIDYVNPDDEGQDLYDWLSEKSRGFVSSLEKLTGLPVTFVGTGGPKLSVIRRQQ
jgi:adenylosuccinate synthase